MFWEVDVFGVGGYVVAFACVLEVLGYAVDGGVGGGGGGWQEAAFDVSYGSDEEEEGAPEGEA